MYIHIGEDTKLEVLNLKGNQLGDEGALMLAAALHSNKSIRTLDMSNNDIQAAGKSRICVCVRARACACASASACACACACASASEHPQTDTPTHPPTHPPVVL